MTRPNIILITSDQHRGDCFGFGPRGVKTPHIDEIASAGTRFSSCITPSLVCQPARASILTGLYPRTHGVRDNGIDLPEATAQAGFAGSLARAGYTTAIVGKGHFSTGETFQPTGRRENRGASAAEPDQPYMGFQHVELMRDYKDWLNRDGRGAEREALRKARLAPDTEAARCWNSALPVAWHDSTWIGDRSVRYLETAQDCPFLLWVSFPDPHVPFDPPEPWSRMYPHDAVDLPKHWELDLDTRPWWHRASLENEPDLADERLKEIRAKASRLPRQTETQLRHITANYYAMISLIDHQVGRIVDCLDRQNLRDDTIVIFASDHGELLGDHGLMLKGPTPYEGLLTVGMVARGPGIPKGRVVDDPVSTLDLAATFYDYAGLPPRNDIHSRSLRGLIEGQGTGRDFAYSEWELDASRCGVALSLATVRTRHHKLTVDRTSGAGEMYDLQVDPDEMRNVFSVDAYRALRKELLSMIASRPSDQCDPPLPIVGMA